MDSSLLFLALTHIVFTAAAVYEGTLFYGCFQSGVTQVQGHWNGGQILYADFEKGQQVWTVPEEVLSEVEGKLPEFYDLAKLSKLSVCAHFLPSAVKMDKSPTEAQAPSAVIYPRREAELGVENTLFCYARRFYPPSIKVTWTRNGVKLTEGVALSHLYPEDDGTFSQLASFSFHPETGVVLGCMVEHQTLNSPANRTWAFEPQQVRSGPLVLCVVGVAVGSLCLTAGVVLFLRALVRPLTPDLRSVNGSNRHSGWGAEGGESEELHCLRAIEGTAAYNSCTFSSSQL